MENVTINKSRLTWIQPRSFYAKKDPENLPLPRNGHSFVIVSGVGFLFGGVVSQAATGQPCATNELFTLRLGVSDVMWEKVALDSGQLPPQRSHHSVTDIGNKFIIFGGSSTSALRLNDLWVFDTLQMSWTQPNVPHNDTMIEIINLSTNAGYSSSSITSLWKNAPSARCGHTMTLIGDCAWVFGGYGGGGYSRRDLDDLFFLDIVSWTWTKVQARGLCPEKRSDHQACAVGSKLYIVGGRCSGNQYADVWMLETAVEPPMWTCMSCQLQSPRWCHCAVSVPAIPSWKIFVFGGYHGRTNNQSRSPSKTNSVAIMDTDILRWTMPEMIGTVPNPMSNSRMFFDQKGSRLILVGGCDEEWTNSVYSLDVGGVVGPPYALTEISPKNGPCTGGSEIDLVGLDFLRCREAVVRFGDMYRFKDVVGTVVSSTKITCRAPKMELTESSGAEIASEVRVAMNGESFTTTFQVFKFFSVTDAKMCIAFGPGLINGGAIGEETTFIIVARDSFGNPRTTGFDEFKIKIVFIGGEESEDVVLSGIRIRDSENGKYVVSFSAPYPGDYEIYAEFLGSFGGKKGLLAISGNRIKFDEMATRDNNSFAGPLMTKTICKEIDELHAFAKKTNDGLSSRVWGDEWKEDEVIDALARIKELINECQKRKDDMVVSFEKCSTVLSFMKNINAVDTIGLEVKLQAAKELWDNACHDSPQVMARVLPLIRSHSVTVRDKVQKFDQEMQLLSSEINHCAATDFDCGLEKAHSTIVRFKALIDDHGTIFLRLFSLANVFGCQSEIEPSQSYLTDCKAYLGELEALWKFISESMSFIGQVGSLLWMNLDGKGTEENVRITLHSIKKFSRKIRECGSYHTLEKQLLDFQMTCPVLVCLKSSSIRDRHWKEIMRKIGKEIPIPATDPNMLVSQILQLNLNCHSDFIRELQERAEREDRHEKEIVEIEKDLTMITFQSCMYKDSNTLLYNLSKESKYTLESHQLSLLAIVTSKNSFFKQQASSLNDELAKVNEMDQCLQSVQDLWKYLESFYVESEDVKQVLSSECDRFNSADNEFRQMLKKIGSCASVRLTLGDANLLKRLHSIEKEFEVCRKGLMTFLNNKRQQLPRLCFLDEADLLDIVSNSSTPRLSLMHIGKLIENVKEIVVESRFDEFINEEKLYAVSFVAKEGGEEVDFMPPVALDGKLERYITAILISLETTIRKHTASSMKRFASQARHQWCLSKSPDDMKHRNDDCCQSMLLVARIRQVSAVEGGILEVSRGVSSGIQQQIDVANQHLSDLNDLLRTPLTSYDRIRTSSLIMLDMHHRDVMDKLVELRTSNISDFIWQSQLRPYYVVSGEEILGGVSVDFNMSECSIPYGFEYIGNAHRLVMTPESDRMFGSVVRALHFKQLCNIGAEIGSSMTSSIKEFAAGVGRCLMIFEFNFSMSLDSLFTFLKGCASTGSWSCLKCFDSVSPSVGSSFSSTMTELVQKCYGIELGNRETSKFVIGGEEIYLSGFPVIFFSRSPNNGTSYENFANMLKTSRPISIHKPNIQYVSKILLSSFGLRQSYDLSSSVASLMTLCRSNLPVRCQYSFQDNRGYSALYRIPKLQSANPDKEESWLLSQALNAEFFPSLVEEDKIVFSNIVDGMFGKSVASESKMEDSSLASLLAAACESYNVWPDEEFVKTATRLCDFMEKQRSSFVLGECGAGKTSLWKVALKAMSGDNPTNVIEVYQDALSFGQILGYFDDESKSWREGILTKNLRNCKPSQTSVIVFDGIADDPLICAVHSIWSNNYLTLPSCQRLQTSNVKVILETDQISHASPSSISKAGLVYLNRETGCHWQGLIGCWIQQVPDTLLNDGNRLKLHDIFQTMVVGCLKTLSTLDLSIVLPDVSLVSSLLSCLDSILPLFSSKEEISTKKNLSREVTDDNIVDIFTFCALWVFGGILHSDDGDNCASRVKFSEWWRQTTQNERLPSRDTVFDYWLNPVSRKFEPWKTCDSFQYLAKEAADSISDVFVPTSDNVSSFHWARLLSARSSPINLVGSNGCGKTLTLAALQKYLENSEYLCSNEIINRLVSPLQIQQGIESKLVRTKPNALGPPSNFLGMTVFLDDIHLAAPQTDDRSCIWSLARQLVEKKSWYALNDWNKIDFERLNMVVASNPEAMSHSYDKRFFRHFTSVSVIIPQAASLITIYQSRLDNYFRINGFQPTVSTMSSVLARTAVSVHKDLGEALKSSHDYFSRSLTLRSLSNVVDGIQLSSPNIVDKPEKMAYLWLHESERAYCDKLSTIEEIGCYRHVVTAAAKKSFPQYNLTTFIKQSVVEETKSEENDTTHSITDSYGLIFGHVSQSDGIGAVYDKIEVLEPMKTSLTKLLEESRISKANIEIDLNQDFLVHVIRVSRILGMPKCHATLIGEAGCGKCIIAKTAALFCGSTIIVAKASPEKVNRELRADLQSGIRKLLTTNSSISIVVSDDCLQDGNVMSLVLEILKANKISDLFSEYEAETMMADFPASNTQRKGSMLDFLWHVVSKRLHCILCIRAASLRKLWEYGATSVMEESCTYRIPHLAADRFIGLGVSNLRSVIQEISRILSMDVATVNIEDVEKDVTSKFESCLRIIHSKYAAARSSLPCFINPTGLRGLHILLSALSRNILLCSARNENEINQKVLSLERLKQCKQDVVTLGSRLKVLLSEASEKKQTCEENKERMEASRSDLEAATSRVRADESVVAEAEIEENRVKKEIEADFVAATPILASMEAAIESINPRDLSAVKSMFQPPKGCEEVFASVIILLAGVDPNVVIQKNGRVKDKDRQWEASKRVMLSNVTGFVDSLRRFKGLIDEGIVPSVNWSEVRPYFDMEAIDEDSLSQRLTVAHSLFQWVKNAYKYHEVVEAVEPKRVSLESARQKLSQENEKLSLSNVQLQVSITENDKNVAKYEESLKTMHDCEVEAERGKLQLSLSSRLVSSIGCMEEVWTSEIQRCRMNRLGLIRECLIGTIYSVLVSFCELSFSVQLESLVDSLKPALNELFGSCTFDQDDERQVFSLLSQNLNESFYKTMASTLPKASISVWRGCGVPVDFYATRQLYSIVSGSNTLFVYDSCSAVIPSLALLPSFFKNNEIRVVSSGSDKLQMELCRSMESGSTLFIECDNANLPSWLEGVMAPDVVLKNHKTYKKVQDNEVEILSSFRLVLMMTSVDSLPKQFQGKYPVVRASPSKDFLSEGCLTLLLKSFAPDVASFYLSMKSSYHQTLLKASSQRLEILDTIASMVGDPLKDKRCIDSVETIMKQSEETSKRYTELGLAMQKLLNYAAEFIGTARIISAIVFQSNSLNKTNLANYFSQLDLVQLISRLSPTTQSAEKLQSAGIKVQIGSWKEDVLRQLCIESEDDSRYLKTRWSSIDQTLESFRSKPITQNGMDKKLIRAVVSAIALAMDEKSKLLMRLVVSEAMSQKSYDGLRLTEVMRSLSSISSRKMVVNEEMRTIMSERSWLLLRQLQDQYCETYPVMEGLIEKLCSSSESWIEWMKSTEPEAAKLPGELSETPEPLRFAFVCCLRPDRTKQVFEAAISSNDPDKHFKLDDQSISNTLMNSINSVPTILFHQSNFDVDNLLEILNNLSSKKVISLKLGSDLSGVTTAIQSAAQLGNWILCSNLHLADDWLDRERSLMESTILRSNPSFRIFFTVETSKCRQSSIPNWFMTVSSRCFVDGRISFLDCLKSSWKVVPKQAMDIGKKNEEMKSLLFGLCCLHACLQSRSSIEHFGWLSKPFLTSNDASLAVQSLDGLLGTIYGADDSASTSKVSLFKSIKGSLQSSIYGSIFENEVDQEIAESYINKIFHKGLFECGEILNRLRAPRASDLDYKGYQEYINGIGLDIDFLGTSALERQLQGIGGQALMTMFGLSSNNDVNVVESQQEFDRTRALVEEVFVGLPSTAETKDRAELFSGEDRSVYLPILISDVMKLNHLLHILRKDMDSVSKFLSGETACACQRQLAIFQSLKAAAVSKLWQAESWITSKSLPYFVDRLSKTSHQLKTWGESMKVPEPLWATGLFNPLSLLTCTKALYLRMNREADDVGMENLVIESHVLVGKRLRADDASDDQFHGVLLSGFSLSGCRWTDDEDDVSATDYTEDHIQCGGYLAALRPWSVYLTLPTIYMKASLSVETKQPVAQAAPKKTRMSMTKKASAEETAKSNFYSCPVYESERRERLMFRIDLRTNVDDGVWKQSFSAAIIE